MNKVVKWSAIGTVIGGAILLKDYLGSTSYQSKINLEGQTVIVTGANCGIGKESALQFAHRGATVILGCRNMKKCTEVRKEIILETRNKQVFCRECDLASFSSVRQFVKDVHEISSQVNILVNNAGVMGCSKSVTKDGIETHLGTNHFGHFLLTMLLMESIKKAAPSRILNLSCIAHKKGEINFRDLNLNQNYDSSSAYNNSKLANIYFTVELARRLEGTGVTCNAVDPGLVNTDLTRHMGFHNSWVAAMLFRPLMWLLIKSSEQGAQVVLRAALNEDLALINGKYLQGDKITEPDEVYQDKEIGKRLWLVSERWTKLDMAS